MKPIVTFFGTQPYEQESFDALNRDFGFEFRYFKGHLSRQTVVATHGAQAACIFVNDTADAEVMRELARNGVRLLALRCARLQQRRPGSRADLQHPRRARTRLFAPCRRGVHGGDDALAQPQDPARKLGARATATSRCKDSWDSI